MAYEILPGNTADHTTLRGFLAKIESLYGKARRVWVMDRGIPTEQTLSDMRDEALQYLVGTPRAKLNTLEKQLLELQWRQVRQDVQVKLLAQDGEVYVLARSSDRRKKEKGMRRKKLRRLWDGLRQVQRNCRSRDRLLERLGALKHEAGRAAKLVEITVPPVGSKVTPETFRFRLKADELRRARRREGSYLLRTNLTAAEPETLWELYVQLTQIEAAFRCLKTDLQIRPIHHQLEHRVEAHILVAFLAYCLMVTLRSQLVVHAPGLTPKAVLENLAAIRMVDVFLPTTDGRCLVMPRYTQPEAEHQMILQRLDLSLPDQPPPRICGRQTDPVEPPAV